MPFDCVKIVLFSASMIDTPAPPAVPVKEKPVLNDVGSVVENTADPVADDEPFSCKACEQSMYVLPLTKICPPPRFTLIDAVDIDAPFGPTADVTALCDPSTPLMIASGGVLLLLAAPLLADAVA